MRFLTRGMATLAVSAALLSVQGLASQADAAGVPVQGPAASRTWAGYALVLSTFHDVSASWVQPAVTCNAGNDQTSAWLGMDGDGSPTVEQIGTMGVCDNGVPSYHGVEEMFPQESDDNNFPDPVQAGDRFTADVSTDGKGTFVLTLHDLTQNWTESQTKVSQSGATGQSAEIISEDPTNTESTPFPLGDYGTVNFTDVQVDHKSLALLDPWQINTVASDGTAKQTTSDLSPAGGFSVTWNHS